MVDEDGGKNPGETVGTNERQSYLTDGISR